MDLIPLCTLVKFWCTCILLWYDALLQIIPFIHTLVFAFIVADLQTCRLELLQNCSMLGFTWGYETQCTNKNDKVVTYITTKLMGEWEWCQSGTDVRCVKRSNHAHVKIPVGVDHGCSNELLLCIDFFSWKCNLFPIYFCIVSCVSINETIVGNNALGY